MKKEEIVKHWLKSAERNTKVAEDNLKLGHYDWSLFVWHLAIEKTLKAKIANSGKNILFIHDLSRLARVAGFNLTRDDKELLDEITTFNIEARYDDYRLNFYKKATKIYAEKWSKICQILYNQLKDQI